MSYESFAICVTFLLNTCSELTNYINVCFVLTGFGSDFDETLGETDDNDSETFFRYDMLTNQSHGSFTWWHDSRDRHWVSGHFFSFSGGDCMAANKDHFETFCVNSFCALTLVKIASPNSRGKQADRSAQRQKTARQRLTDVSIAKWRRQMTVAETAASAAPRIDRISMLATSGRRKTKIGHRITIVLLVAYSNRPTMRKRIT